MEDDGLRLVETAQILLDLKVVRKAGWWPELIAEHRVVEEDERPIAGAWRALRQRSALEQEGCDPLAEKASSGGDREPSHSPLTLNDHSAAGRYPSASPRASRPGIPFVTARLGGEPKKTN